GRGSCGDCSDNHDVCIAEFGGKCATSGKVVMPEYVPLRARKLRYKQFAAKYVKTGFNGLQTVLECGFTENEDSAKVIACRLLTYVYVNNQIEKHMSKAKMSADEVVEELTSIARSNVEVGAS